MGNFKEDIAKVKALVFDVDGVFTDGSICPLPEGDFIRFYYAKDGYAVASALREGYTVAIITGGRGQALEKRFAMLGVKHFYSNIVDKLTVLKGFMQEQGLSPDELLFMGDDIPDLDAMRHVGMPVCPSDAASEILAASRYVSQFPGGRGCVRDIVEQVMRAGGKWAKNSLGVNTVPSA